jgi:hypothetical protein
MPDVADLVHETTVGTGTGNLTVAAVLGKRTFNTAFGTGGTDLFDYFISNRAAAEWEVGTGHLSDATTLVRDTVVLSSNSNNAVNFSAGTKDVANDVPASVQNALLGTGDIASQANQEAGTSTALLVTPGRQHFHPGHPKLWAYVTVSSGTPTLETSYNVTSIGDTAAGILTVTIATDFSTANWSPHVTAERTTTSVGGANMRIPSVRFGGQAAGTIIVEVDDDDGGLKDPAAWSVMGLGDHA